jgi:hypothetical protein
MAFQMHDDEVGIPGIRVSDIAYAANDDRLTVYHHGVLLNAR